MAMDDVLYNPWDDNGSTGLLGELVAKEYLVKRGYEFVDGNMRVGHLEIDLLMRKGDLMVYVEVKSSKAGSWERIVGNLSGKKLRRVFQACVSHHERFYQELPMRVDCVCVQFDWKMDVRRIRHMTNLSWDY